jgi:hypothetical protein
MNSAPSWTPYCGVTGNSHAHLIYCCDCHAKNPQFPHTVSTSHSVQNVEVVEVPDSPPKPSISTTTQIAPRFGSYNRTHGAEAHRRSGFLQPASAVRSGGRQNPTPAGIISYRTIATFYLLEYRISQEMNSEGLAQINSIQYISKFI